MFLREHEHHYPWFIHLFASICSSNSSKILCLLFLLTKPSNWCRTLIPRFFWQFPLIVFQVPKDFMLKLDHILLKFPFIELQYYFLNSKMLAGFVFLIHYFVQLGIELAFQISFFLSIIPQYCSITFINFLQLKFWWVAEIFLMSSHRDFYVFLNYWTFTMYNAFWANTFTFTVKTKIQYLLFWMFLTLFFRRYPWKLFIIGWVIYFLWLFFITSIDT